MFIAPQDLRCGVIDKLEFVYQNLYHEYISIPRPADMSIISIGVGFFLNASFATMLININMSNTTIEIVSIYSRLDSLNFIICKGAGSSLRSDK